jgi:quercetin dioxygenase-like cupin family protein
MFLKLENLSANEAIPGYHGKFVHTENMTIAYWEIETGAPLPAHSHFHEQVANVIAGEFELTINGETQILRPGSVAVIPAHAEHSGRAITDCQLIDIFSPVREDYQNLP